MKPIGGYFELELNKCSYQYHDTPYLTKSGRCSLLSILGAVKPALVYIPYYTCDSLIEPFVGTGIKYQFYGINELLEPKLLPELKPGEYFLYVNYLDIKREAVTLLSEKYKDKLIVDCTQAFFMKGNGVSWYFNSCRKFFGVPDGSYLYAPEGVQMPGIESRNEAYITDHLIQRFNGHAQEGYASFQKNEELAGKGLYGMSKLSEYLLSNINYKEVLEKRRANYEYLNDRLTSINLLNAQLCADNVPIGYPLLLNKYMDRREFFSKNIFIPTYWKDTQDRNIAGFAFEKDLTDRLYPLPVDHRYSLEDMELLYSSIKSILL